MNTRELLACAKLNWTLAIVGRRDDGMHLIDSIFVPVSLFDRIYIERIHVESMPPTSLRSKQPFASDVVVEASSAGVPSGQANLAHQAAAAYGVAAAARVQLHLFIEKHIPTGAGLGGGSSDAAAVLRALENASPRPIGAEELHRVAATLGSDVPFFLKPGAKRATGVGDSLEPFAGELPKHFVLCSDGVALSTREVYRAYDDALTSQSAPSKRSDSVVGGEPSSGGKNDLEAAAIRLHPGIIAVRDEMLRLGLADVAMTGSGSVLFGTTPFREEASQVSSELRRRGYWSEVADSIC